MVDAVIDGIVGSLELFKSILIDIVEDTCIGRVNGCEAIGQVDDLACLTFLEQCGITLAIDLLYLPTDWWQHQRVLTRHGVGLHRHALALHHSSSLVAIAASMREGELARLQVGVLVVVDQPRRVVAL